MFYFPIAIFVFEFIFDALGGTELIVFRGTTPKLHLMNDDTLCLQYGGDVFVWSAKATHSSDGLDSFIIHASN